MGNSYWAVLHLIVYAKYTLMCCARAGPTGGNIPVRCAGFSLPTPTLWFARELLMLTIDQRHALFDFIGCVGKKEVHSRTTFAEMRSKGRIKGVWSTNIYFCFLWHTKHTHTHSTMFIGSYMGGADPKPTLSPPPKIHDPVAWATKYNAVRHDRDAAAAMRVDIARQTMDCARACSYTLADGTTVRLDANAAAHSRATVLYDDEKARRMSERIQQSADVKQQLEVVVHEGDCLDLALSLKRDDPQCRPLVLNMASYRHPGGGFLKGSAAQEESIFRRSTYHLALMPLKRNFYPFSDLDGIYSPGILVFRASEAQGFAFLPEPVSLDFVAVAACRRPRLLANAEGAQVLDRDSETLTENKIRLMLDIGRAHQHDTLVLGAFGCGAFGNPPQHVAQIFRRVLSEPVYRYAFHRVYFAIIDDHNAHRQHNREGNLAPFARVFEHGLLPEREDQPEPPTESHDHPIEPIRQEPISITVDGDASDRPAGSNGKDHWKQQRSRSHKRDPSVFYHG